jgi:hypothetical protein
MPAGSSCAAAGRRGHWAPAAAALAAPVPAVAATPGAPLHLSIEPGPQGLGGLATFPELWDVSCTSQAFCVAVGQTGSDATATTLAEIWNGQRWAVSPSPNQGISLLAGVSCVSAAFCMAVGQPNREGRGLAEVWNGTDWKIVPSPRAGNGETALVGVSCTSPSYCVAAGSFSVGASRLPLIETWNGLHWSIASIPSASGRDVLLDAVSCASPAFCQAVGLTSGPGANRAWLLETWRGHAWQASTGPPGTELYDVSCVGADFCMTVGSRGSASLTEVWDGTRWSPLFDPAYATGGLSCTTTSLCFVTGSTGSGRAPGPGLVEMWNGGGWQSVPISGGAADDQLVAVSCTTAYCASVGYGSSPAEQVTAGGTVNPAALTPPAGYATSACRAAADVSFENELDKASADSIPIPGASIDMPGGLSGQATVTFTPGDITVCAKKLVPALNTPFAFDGGQLSLSVPLRGPFVYDSAATAWTKRPGAPTGQQWVTTFAGAKISAQADPSLSATLSANKPDIDLDLADVTLTAPGQIVTLVSSGNALLQAGLAPTLNFSVSVSRAAAEEDVTDEEAQGATSEDAITDTSDQLGGDATVAIDEEASEFYQITIPLYQEQGLFVALRQQLTLALTGDPYLAGAVTSADADAVPADISPTEADNVDAALGSDVVDAGGLDDLVTLFILF